MTKNAEKLFHCSPRKIDTIHKKGRFGEFLFFAVEPYSITSCPDYEYSIEIDDDEIIEARVLFYIDEDEVLTGMATEVGELLSVGLETAMGLIGEEISIYDLDLGLEYEKLGEWSWDLQLYAARAAKLLGYRAVELHDEQGSVWLIDMFGFENELTLIGIPETAKEYSKCLINA